jgi:ribosome biogenesis GTPase
MSNLPSNLENLGFNHWFQNQVESTKLTDFQIARVTAVHKDSYHITNGIQEIAAEITGKLMFVADSPLDYPTVGDWCYVQYFDEDSLAIIHEIIPRKSVLKRKTAGKKVEFQLIAANIDTAFIIQSLDFDYNLRRLERYLVMVNESHIQPVVLLSKSDLLSSSELEEKITKIDAVIPNVQVIAFSNTNHTGLARIKDLLLAGQTFCLLGSSGVGKTTLLNNVLGKSVFETQTVRNKEHKGKHTTTRRQLIHLENGAMLIDVPGIRELGNMEVESGLSETFSEISNLSNQCRYTDCSHTQEKGCAVLAALKKEVISTERYQNYLKMLKESAFNEMSYLEKRHKDKQLSQMYKSVLKHKGQSKK